MVIMVISHTRGEIENQPPVCDILCKKYIAKYCKVGVGTSCKRRDQRRSKGFAVWPTNSTFRRMLLITFLPLGEFRLVSFAVQSTGNLSPCRCSVLGLTTHWNQNGIKMGSTWERSRNAAGTQQASQPHTRSPVVEACRSDAVSQC